MSDPDRNEPQPTAGFTAAQERLAAGETLPVEPMYLRRPDALTTAERGARA